LNLIDFGMDVQEAGEAPRFRHMGNGVAFESGVDIDILQGLVRRGHRPMTRFGAYGGYQAILIDSETGVLMGGSDPRKDGCAVGY
jgi:gamma-glutamyltranspeptidase/glutathione hydrolase